MRDDELKDSAILQEALRLNLYRLKDLWNLH